MTANRGKYAESKVKDYLKALETRLANFTFNRISDAHAAGGRAQPQPGDFQAFMRVTGQGVYFQDVREQTPEGLTMGSKGVLEVSRNWLIEVKEVKHSFRLPHKNYGPDSVARMHKRVLAGSEPIVLIFHTEEKLWRHVPFEVFLTRTGGSWDLRPYPTFDYKHTLDHIFGVQEW